MLTTSTKKTGLAKPKGHNLVGAKGKPLHKAGNGYQNPFWNSPGLGYLGSNRGILELKALAARSPADIRKAAQVIGIPPNASNELALFVPQDLRQAWSAVIASQKDIVLTKILPVVPAFSTQVEWVVKTATGGRALQTHFMAEAGPIVGNNQSVARDGTANVALFGDRRTLSGVSQIVGMIGGVNPGGAAMVSRDGLQMTTADMIREQITEYERFLFFADSDVNAYEFDGVVKQIRDNGTAGIQVHDMLGESLTFERFLQDAARLTKEPTFAEIEYFVLSSETYASLQIQGSDTKRWVQGIAEIDTTSGRWQFNPARMCLIGPMNNRIDFKVATFLANNGCPAYPTVNTNSPAVTLTTANLTSNNAGGSGTTFPAGTYRVGIVGSFLNGSSAGFYTDPIVVTDGQEITIVMNDAAYVSSTTNPLQFYWAYLTDDTGAVSSLKPIGRFVAGNVSGHTEFVVDYSTIPGTDTALGLMVNGNGGPGLFRAELLASTRFPIPNATMVGVMDMVLCNITTPIVAHYEQQLLYFNIRNVGVIA